MSMRRTQTKGGLGVLLTLSLLASFSLSSFAAGSGSMDEEIPDSLLVSQALTGALTTHGPVIVNGNEAKTGSTVADGSVIQTRTGGHAIIDLGATTGRVELDPITAITLTWTDKSVQASLDKCGQGVTLVLPAGVSGLVKILNMTDVGVLKKDREVDVKVFKGEALVKYGQGKEKIVKAGDHKEFDNAIEVTAVGEAIVKVYCLEDNYPILLWAGLAALAIPARELVGGEAPPLLSPAQP